MWLACALVHTLILLLVQLFVAFLGFVSVTESVFRIKQERNPLFKWLPQRLALDSEKWLASGVKLDDYEEDDDPSESKCYCGVVCCLLTSYWKDPAEVLNL